MEVFDYVIIGAGTAGCVVAHRLSTSGRDRVLLLEAGGTDQRLWVRLPIGYGNTFADPRVNWVYETQEDPGIGGRRAYWPRGKVLGGSGSINALVHFRGLPQDYDSWESAGNPGWAWNDVRPVFERRESLGALGHGRGAPGDPALRVTDVARRVHPLCRRYIEAAATLGFRQTADFNGADPEGVGMYRILTRDGLRESTARAYLRPVLNRPNLTLRLHCHTTRIITTGGRAVGVIYRRKGREVEVRARRSVILCAGAINSPQLLQLSGIGPADVLQRQGIPVVLNAPAVGRNLQDHLSIAHVYRSRVPTLNSDLEPWFGKLKIAVRYAFTRTGPLSMSVNQGGGFVRSDPDQPAPDLQLYFTPSSYTERPGRQRRLLRPDPFPGFLMMAHACRPTSRGYLEIQSADPFDPPAIHPRYLSTDHDIALALAGARLLRRFAATRPLADIISEELLPGSDVRTDEALLEDFRQRAGTVYHPTCTCRMGPDPETAVVDNRLRLHGLTGLRVIDASVFPSVTSGNTNAPTVMVAERGAAMLLEDGA